MSESQNARISVEECFLFDLNGFLILRNVLSAEECAGYLETLSTLENRTYEDKWMDTVGPGRPTRETRRIHQIRLNGLPRLHSIFDGLIDHSRILPYLYEFVGEPQLINTWSISKFCGAEQGGWHRGVPTTDYSYSNGLIRSRMFNVVFFLTDNGAAAVLGNYGPALADVKDINISGRGRIGFGTQEATIEVDDVFVTEPGQNPFAVEAQGKLATTWGRLKSSVVQ